MKWYPWLTPHYKQLVELYYQDKAHHALLLNTPVPVGEDLLAQALAKWLMCDNTKGLRICHQCHNCKMMQAKTHPDWHVIETTDNKQLLGIESIRQLTDALFRHAQQGGNKLVWLPKMELLTESAANALLKTLEEPPSNSFFILGCGNLQILPATIRSRCFVWTIPAPNEHYSLQWLKHNLPQQSDDNLISALRICSGSPIQSLEILQSDKLKSKYQFIHKIGQSLQQKNIVSLLTSLKESNSLEYLFWMITLWADAIKWHNKAYSFIINIDSQQVIQQLAESGTITKLHQQYQLLLRTHQQLKQVSGLNSTLILTDVFCRLIVS